MISLRRLWCFRSTRSSAVDSTGPEGGLREGLFLEGAKKNPQQPPLEVCAWFNHTCSPGQPSRTTSGDQVTPASTTAACSRCHPPTRCHTNTPRPRLLHPQFSVSGREERAVGPSFGAPADPPPSPPCHRCGPLPPVCTHPISLFKLY